MKDADWIISLITTKDGDIERVGIKKITPMDRLNMNLSPGGFGLYPSPEIKESLRALIAEAKQLEKEYY